MPGLEEARALDAADPLRTFRDAFVLPLNEQGAPVLYFCGHSLGLQPLAARARVAEELDAWARLAVLGHEQGRRPWVEYHEQLTAGLQQVTGATAREVVAMNSLTINLHLMLASFYRPEGRRTKILMESGAFSSDRHAVASHIAWHGLDPAVELIELGASRDADLIAHEEVESALMERDGEIALLLWPSVQYRTGQAFDIARLAAAARRHGAVAGFDLAHSIGNLPHRLHDDHIDFAVWCSYKYLNGGPGAIGGAFIHERHLDREPLPRLAGWWGHDRVTRFQLGREFHPQDGAAGWQVSNPSVLAAAPLLASLELFQQAGMRALREKSVQLTGFLARLLAARPDLELLTPADPAARGAQLSLRIAGHISRGKRVYAELLERGAIVDWREPDVIRAAPAPLYTRFADVHAFAGVLREALELCP